MESEILPIIEGYLSEERLLGGGDYEVSIHHTVTPMEGHDPIRDIYIQIFLKKGREELCAWSENLVDGEVLFYVNGDFRKKRRCIDFIKLAIDNNRHLYAFQMDRLRDVMKENSLLSQKNKELFEHNEKLRAKNREFRYAPGANGFLKTREHFMGLM